jgi:hypothetical protein
LDAYISCATWSSCAVIADAPGRRDDRGRGPRPTLALVRSRTRSLRWLVAEQVRPALTAAVGRLPERPCRSMTWEGHSRARPGSPPTPGSRRTSAIRAAPGSGPAVRTPTGCCASTCPGPSTCAASARPTWTASPPNQGPTSTGPRLSGTPHAYSRGHCADPMRPPRTDRSAEAGRVSLERSRCSLRR